MGDKTASGEPNQPAAGANQPGDKPTLPPTSGQKLDQFFKESLDRSRAGAGVSTDDTAAGAPAKQDDERPEATPEAKKKRKYEFAGEIGDIEIDDDSPDRGKFDKLQAEVRHRRQAEGNAKNELDAAKKRIAELEAAGATNQPPAPNPNANEKPPAAATAPDAKALAAKIQAALDDADGDGLAAIILELRHAQAATPAPAPDKKTDDAASKRIAALEAELADIRDLYGDDLEQKRTGRKIKTVATYIKEAHQAELTAEESAEFQPQAQKAVDAALEDLPEGTPPSVVEKLVRQAIDIAYTGYVAKQTKESTTPPSVSASAALARRMAGDRASNVIEAPKQRQMRMPKF